MPTLLVAIVLYFTFKTNIDDLDRIKRISLFLFSMDWAELEAECGYADQIYLIRK